MRLALRFGTLLAIPLAVTALAGQASTVTGFTVHLPPQVRPETVIINYGLSGVTPGVSFVTTRPGVSDYALPVAKATSLKLLIYIPGYRMVTQEFRGAAVTSTRFVPPLTTLATARLDGSLVDSSQRPIPNQWLNVNYPLIEAMSYFGYMDGPVPTLELGRSRTDDTGAFTFELPSFRDDPFFTAFTRADGPGFRLTVVGAPGVGPSVDLQPSSFSGEEARTSPLRVVEVRRGILAGRLGPDFLQRNGLGNDMAAYRLDLMQDSRPLRLQLDADVDSVDGARADGRGEHFLGFNAMLKRDGTFEVQLPPGHYDLSLSVMGPGEILQRRIPVQKDVAIRESQRYVVERP